MATENNTVYFVRVMDGYYIPENSISISVSKDTKEINEYSRAWYRKPIKYEKAKKSIDEAYDVIKKKLIMKKLINILEISLIQLSQV